MHYHYHWQMSDAAANLFCAVMVCAHSLYDYWHLAASLFGAHCDSLYCMLWPNTPLLVCIAYRLSDRTSKVNEVHEFDDLSDDDGHLETQ